MDFWHRCRMPRVLRVAGAMIAQPVTGSKSCFFFFLTYPEQPLVSPIKQRGKRGVLKESGTGLFPLFPQQHVLPVSPAPHGADSLPKLVPQGRSGCELSLVPVPPGSPGIPVLPPAPCQGPAPPRPAARRCQTAGSCGDTATTTSCRGLQHGGGRERPWGAGLSQALIPAVGFLSSFLLSPVLSAGSGEAER